MEDSSFAPLQHTFVLSRPLKSQAGAIIRQITVTEPEQHHVVAAERAHPSSETEQSVHMLAALTGLHRDQVLGMSIPDAQRIQRWMERIMADAGHGDPPARFDEDYRTFVLCAPVETDRVPLTEVTVRPPDLASSIVAEKFKSESERLAAMIAELTGLTIPLVLRMKRRDIARIERWLTPFVVGSFSNEDEPGVTLPSDFAVS